MTGDWDRSAKAYEVEVAVYQNLPTTTSRPPPNLDIMELFSGVSKPSALASSYGLRAAQPIDLKFGWDLDSPEHQRSVRQAIDRLKPWLLIVGYPCTKYSIMNENANYGHRREELLELRQRDRRMLKFVTDLLQEQHAQGRFFVLENPLRSRLWEQPALRQLLDTPGIQVTSCHAGAYGAENADGEPIIKPLKFAGNLPAMMARLGRKLSATDCRYCTPVQGRRTKASQEYPDALAHVMVESHRDHLRQRDPQP